MFGFLKQARPQPAGETETSKPVISAFGKLPIRADFIKHNVSEREIRELDQWVQEGYALISRRLNGDSAADAFASADIHHLVFAPTNDRRAVLACIGPGSDQSGRWYPFVVASLAQAPFIKKVQAAVPVTYAPFFDQAHRIVGQRWRQEPLETLLGFLSTLAHSCKRENRTAMVDQELGLLRETQLTCIREMSERVTEEPEAFFQAVIDLISAVIRRGAARTSWGIRLPLPADENSTPVLVFWLRLIDSLLGQNWTGNYFWRPGQGAELGHLTVFFRRVPPSFLPHLFKENLEDGTVQTLTPLLAQPTTPSRRARDLAAMEQGSLLDLLSRFVSGGSL